MPEPNDVLAQLLSPQQAGVLAAGGATVWETAAQALATIAGSAPSVSDVDGRLVMPDEIAGDFADGHLVAPVALSTNRDQSAVAYLVANTDIAAMFFDSQADDPADQEQQTMVMASAILGQLLQAVNLNVFGDSPTGLVLSLDDMLANAMPEVLATLDEPGLLLEVTVQTDRTLPFKLFLPGTFLDVVAASLPEVDAAAAGGETKSGEPALDLPFSLTAEELNSAQILDDPPEEQKPAREPTQKREPVRSRASPEPEPTPMAELEPEQEDAGRQPVGGRKRASTQERPREPTPINAAVRRASFAPLADPVAAEHHSPIDLLAGLEMNVSVELGRTELTVAEVLDLGPGSVIELNRLAGEPVDILVNDRVIARGEVVVVDENFGVRVVEVVRRSSRNGKGDE
ncbi:MAG: hypothetical protein Kow0010_21190 [Dehalococcoidia bacterium]